MKTRKLKKRGQNGGITLKGARRLLNSISPSVAIGHMTTRFKSIKVSPLSPVPIGSTEPIGSPGSVLQVSVDGIAKLMEDYDTALPETLDDTIALMLKFEADLKTVIKILRRSHTKTNRQEKNAKTIMDDVGKALQKLERNPEDKVDKNTIFFTEDTIIKASMNLQTSSDILKDLNEAIAKFEKIHDNVRDTIKSLKKEQKKQNGDTNSKIIEKLKGEWIDMQDTLNEAQEIIKQQKEKIAINASHRASSRQATHSQATPRQTSKRLSETRRAINSSRTSRQVFPTGGAQISRSRKHRRSRRLTH